MTMERSFAPAKTNEQALEELDKMSGIRYDGLLVRLLRARAQIRERLPAVSKTDSPLVTLASEPRN